MPQAILARVLEDIKNLDSAERKQVQEALAVESSSTTIQTDNQKFLRAMQDAGLISEIKTPDRNTKRERQPVKIQGKSLSETIIEERR